MESRVYLRILELKDVDRVYQWQNDQELYQSLIGSHHFVSRATVSEWLEKKSAFSNTEINLAICLKNNSEHIGNIYVREIDWINRNATIGLLIGDANHRGKGYGKEAVSLVVEYVFTTMGLNRIYGYLYEHNKASFKTFQAVGFVEEGKLRKHVFQNGKFHDILFVGVCRDDWEKLQGKESFNKTND